MARQNPVVLENSQILSHGTQGPGPKLSPLEVKDILQDPRPAREIAEEYECSRSLIYAIKQGRADTYLVEKAGTLNPVTGLISTHDVPTQLDFIMPVSAPRGGRPVVDDSLYETIKNDLGTCRQIAKKWGISPSTVSRIKSGNYCNSGKDARPPEPKIIAILDRKLVYAAPTPRRKKASE